MNEHQKKNFRIYEAISHEAAMDASETGHGLTDEERAEAYRFAEAFRASIQAKRRADRAAQMKERVRPSILAMARDAVEQWLHELFAAYPTAVIAHRDLTELSDDDLRTALEDALTLIERMHCPPERPTRGSHDEHTRFRSRHVHAHPGGHRRQRRRAPASAFRDRPACR